MDLLVYVCDKWTIFDQCRMGFVGVTSGGVGNGSTTGLVRARSLLWRKVTRKGMDRSQWRTVTALVIDPSVVQSSTASVAQLLVVIAVRRIALRSMDFAVGGKGRGR